MDIALLLVLPIIIPMAAAAITLPLRKRRRLSHGVSLASVLLVVGVAVTLLIRVGREGILAAQMGAWEVPFGITLVADHLSAVMVVISSIVVTAVLLYAPGDIDDDRVRYGFYPLVHVLMAGVFGAFLTGDLFNLYVWFEVLLIASFVLIALGNTRPQLEGAVKYVAVSMIGSILFLSGVGILYGITGTLNMADMSVRLAEMEMNGAVGAAAMLLLVAFGTKAAAFPLFVWLPASYHTPPVVISALFAGWLTKVGIYSLIRAFTLLFVQDTGFTHTLLLWAAGLTMLAGVLGAVAQVRLRRLLAFLVVATIGFMMMGLALYTRSGLTGTVFYLLEDVIVITNLFLIAGIIERATGTGDLRLTGGLYQERPLLAALFVVPAFSLAAFPPLSGFWSKFILGRAGFEAESFWIVAVMLTAGLIGLFALTRVFLAVFWRPRIASQTPDSGGTAAAHAGVTASAETGTAAVATQYVFSARLLIPVVMLVGMTLVISLYPAPFYDIAARAADELVDPSLYVRAVLGP